MMTRFKLNSYFPKLENDELFISNLAVFDNFQKQGVAKRLLNAAEVLAKEKGLKKLSLYLEIDNIRNLINLMKNQCLLMVKLLNESKSKNM
jgi:ribosomal protein S18 acetylase RimI-like enzyme